MGNNDHIPTSEVLQDINDTQKEIDNYRDEKEVLMRNPQSNRLRIYMIDGQISQREQFINQLNEIIKERQ